MKNKVNVKSLFRTSLVALCLLTMGVGNVWAGTRRIYFDYSAVSWWKDFTNLNSGAGFAKVHCWGGNTGDQDYTMSAVAGQTDLAYCDIDDGWTNICFFRCGSEGTWWTKTHDYNGIGSNNRFKIKNEADNDNGMDKYRWADSGGAIRWVPGVCIDGLVNVNNPHTQAFSFSGNNGTYSVTLSAHSTYQFCIRDGATRYTLDNHVWTSNISNYTLNQSTSDYDIRMTTAGAGTYTFAYNKSTHVISVTYPTVSHPNVDYCYMYGYNDWTHKYLHLWNSASGIAGTTWPGTEMFNYITISGEKYYYFAPGDYANSLPNNNNGNQTDNLTNSEGYGKYMKHDGSWGWRTFTVRIQLDDLSATTAVVPTYQDVAFNSGVLTDLTSVPQKTHYDFGGFYTGYDDVNDVATGTQVIDANGQWIASVADYTDASKHWIHGGTETTLYAMWTEHEYDLTINISPAGAGTVSPSPTKVKYVTPTALLTATPSSPAYIFKEWRYSEHVGPYGGTGNNNTVQITASQNGTLTAVFEPRYCLVGEIYEGGGATGGMPGWTTYTKDFTVNTTSPVNLTSTCTLDPNTTFRFNVHDRQSNKNLGHYPAGQYIGNNSWEFANQDHDVLLPTTGHGDYTFTISAIRQDGDAYYPTVSVSGPSSHLMNLGWGHAGIDNTSSVTHGENTGGTVSAQTTENGNHYAIVNGQYVAHGGTITYTPSPATGYTFAGWYSSNAYSGNPFSTNDPWEHSNVTSDDNVFAKFTENSTSVTLSNNGNGHIEIGGVTYTETTCGVTTTRELTAIADDGYKFSGWTKVSGDDITLSSTTDNPTTLTGRGSGLSSGQEVRANFDYRWIVQPEVGEWGYSYFTIDHISIVGGKTIGYVDITLAANTNYQFSVKDTKDDTKYKNGSDQVYYMTNGNSHNWTFATDKTYNCGITTAGAGTYRFIWNITDKTMSVTYPNFVIYRTGDKAGDPRAAYDDVESYGGGTIAKAIEYRMKVHELDNWYTLCLPFTVSAVKVWDEEDEAYYDIVPYWRTGGKYYTGHYIIRTPTTTTNLAIAGFDTQWTDPASSSVLPSANTPYIIQWHDSYFSGRYISFFGSTGQTIPSFSAGSAPSSNEVVNVYGNNSMTSGTVRDAYMLESDYGQGAWLREDVGTYRTVLPFECYILASEATRNKYRVIRPGASADDTTTGWEEIANSEQKTNIAVYTVAGILVAQFSNCSISDAAQRLSGYYTEGLFILHADNRSVKLLLGGK